MLGAEAHAGSFLERPAIESLGASEPALRSGELFAGRYTVEAFVGAGGMGEVYRVTDRMADEVRVALKLLRSGILTGSEGLDRFQSELRIGRSVRHPNVCSLYHLDRATLPDGSPTAFLTMEYLEGATLDQVLSGSTFPPAAVKPILSQLLDGLDACHALGIIHGDLKCGNVMLLDQGPGSPPRVVITDFGLARESMTGAGERVLMGTPAYMPPEQIRCQPITTAADIHALGVMLFRMLSGGFPFEGASAEDIMDSRLARTAPATRLPVGLGRVWSKMVLDCLDADPTRRPTSGELRCRLDLDGRSRTRRQWLLTAAGGVAAAGAVLQYQSCLAARELLAPDLRRHLTLGEDFLSRRGKNDFTNARLEFQKVLDRRPDYAPAWVGLAEAYAGEANWGMTDPLQGRRKAREAAQQAIRLDRSSARAHAALGYASSTDLREWLGAMTHFERALRLDPANPQVLFFYASHLSRLGRFAEAIEVLKKVQLMNPQSLSVNHNLAIANYCAGRKHDFLETARELVRIQPTLANSHLTLAKALLEADQPGEALQESNEAERYHADEPQLLQTRALIAIAMNRRSEALGYDHRLHSLWESRPIEAIVVASVPAALGDLDRAIDDLEAGVARGDSSVLSAPVHPLLSAVRGHPRFARFRARLGLPPARAGSLQD